MICGRALRSAPDPVLGGDQWRWAPPPSMRGQRRRYLHRLAEWQTDDRLYRAACGGYVCQVIAINPKETT